MLRIQIIFLMMLSFFISAGSHALAEEALAGVNGDTITTADVESIFLSVHGGMSQKGRKDFDYRKLVERLVNDRLMIQEAEAIGLAEEEAFLEFMADERGKNASRRFVQDFYRFDQEVTDDEIQEFFNDNYHKVQVRTIALPTAVMADSLRALIEAGVPMDSLAKQHSMDVHRYQGGAHSLMYFAEIENDLRNHLSNPVVGQLMGPFPYREVTLLMQVEKIVPPNQEDLSALQNYIRSILGSEKRKSHWQSFVDSLIQQLGVQRNDALLKAIAADVTPALDSAFFVGSSESVVRIGANATLTESELRLRTAKVAMNAATAPNDSLVEAALAGWMQEQALAQSGTAAGLDSDPRVLAALERTYDSALVEVYIKETVVSQIVFNRGELTSYYEENEEDFREPGKLHLRRMIISDGARADSAYRLLQDGGDFNYVLDRFITEDRRLVEKSEWVSLLAFPQEIRDELNSLSIGAASRPYETPDGWIIFKVLDREEGRLKAPEEVELAIREIIFQRQFNELLDKTLATLKEHSEITYFDDAIDRFLGGNR